MQFELKLVALWLNTGETMKSGNQTQSEKQRLLFAKECRGSGEGGGYIPGRSLRDMGGLGRIHRFACTRCGGRQIVLPSDMALSVFLEEHWDPATYELKEHYPLLDVDETLRLAGELGLKHPMFSDGSPKMLITDLVVSKQIAGTDEKHAIDIVSSRRPNQARILASRAIKQEYWRRLGIPYRVAASDGLNGERAKHLWDLFNIGEQVLTRGITGDERDAQLAILKRFKQGKDQTLLELCHTTARAREIARSDCVAALRRLIATHLIECSLDVTVLLEQPLRGARICLPERVADNSSRRGRRSERGRAAAKILNRWRK